MNARDFKRKLTAVFSADVAGYSRLMGEDEAATVKTLEDYKEVMSSLIKQHRGRVIDSPGDNLLAEFASVVDAVQCGVAAQNEFKARNADLPENRRMQFRIGINLGDVIEEGDRIYGDGVNIAARLESCADPGGICVSKTAFDHIETKLPLGYEYLGEKEVKNITKPVGAYKVLMEPRIVVPGAKKKMPSAPPWRRKGILAGAFAVLIVLIGAAVWNFRFRTPPLEPASKEKMAFPLPDKPSIAVLPFANMSGDPKEDYFSDGLTEQIITSLSMIPRLFVIARNSTFVYKGKAVKVQKVAEEQGVRYVLEGGVEKSQDRVRITVQLIDAIKGIHLWSERYDRDLKDLFALQDGIVRQIMTAVQVKLTEGEYASAAAGSTSNLKALECFWRASEHLNRWSGDEIPAARQWAEKAVELDPNFAGAWAQLGLTHLLDVTQFGGKSPAQSLKRAEECAQKALSINDSTATALSLMAGIRRTQGKWDEAVEYGEKALAINPNDPSMMMSLALTIHYLGRFDEAIALSEKAMRICPYYPAIYLPVLAASYVVAGRYQEAIKASELMLDRSRKGEINPLFAHIFLAEAYVGLDQMDKARAQAEEVLKIDPKFSLEREKRLTAFKDPAIGDRRLAALRKAGLPDKPPLPLPDKPSIAVLPFVNMSEEKGQEYFSDGLTEEIITALSKTPKLFVIASNSSLVYKGKPLNVQQVSRELGVKYVLEGSVRRSGDQLRITSQLIDATTGNHLWAERYDREMKEIFAIQDDITKNIVTALQVQLTEGEQARIYAKGTDKLEAYLKVMEGWWHQQQSTKDGIFHAQKLAEEAIALDPNYAFAYYLLGAIHYTFAWSGLSKNPQKSLALGVELNQKAITLDNSLGIAYGGLGYALLMLRQYDQAIAAGERAFSLEPTSAGVLHHYASILMFAGRNEEAIPLFKEALRLNPRPPNTYYRHYGSALANIGQYDEAIALQKTAIEQEPNDIFAYMVLASVCSMAGRDAEARTAAQEILRLNPKFSVAQVEKVRPDKDRAVAKRWCDTLRQAGLPD
jgi:adenylate cyclase